MIITLLLVLVSAWAMSRILNRRIEDCVPVFLTGTIVFLYIFYLLNCLKAGRIVLYAVCAVLVAAAVFFMLKKKAPSGTKGPRVLTEQFFTPGIVLFLALSTLFVIFAASMRPSVWDELRLWAAMPKALHFTESLQVGEGSLLYSTMQSYPPGMALLIYFFTAFSPSYSYGAAFAVYWIFAAALVLPAFHRFRWEQWYVLPPAFFLLVLFPVLLTINSGGASGDWAYYFTSLFIEPSLGCLFGYTLYQAVRKPFQDGFSAASFALALFVLPSFKNMGGMYASVSFAVAAVLFLLSAVREKRGRSGEASVPDAGACPDKKRKIRPVLFMGISIIGAGLSYASWQIMINTRGTGEFVDVDLVGFTAEKFGNVIKGLTTWGSIPFVYYILFFIAAGLLITWLLKDLRFQESLIAAAGIVLAFLIFLYGYTSHYGLMLSSIHRYTSVFTFACFVYLLMRTASALDPKLKIKSKSSKTIVRRDVPEERAANVKASESVLSTLLPKKGAGLGSVLFFELLLLAAAVLILFSSISKQLKNDSWTDAEQMVRIAESAVLQDLPESSPEHPAKCYLALGGDTRKEAQRHETYALAAIGSCVNIQSIWCDKLVNEAEHGVVSDPKEQAAIWAESLKSGSYRYVIAAQPDQEITDVIALILEADPDQDAAQETALAAANSAQNPQIFEILPSESSYGVTLRLLP